MGDKTFVHREARPDPNIMPSLDSLITRDVESINRGLAKTFKDYEIPTMWYQLAKQHVLDGGKRLRPIICIASCEMLEGNKERVFEAALAVELLHNASLIHDDIIDRDRIRRGKPTIAARFDDFTALLVGDLLFSIAFKVAARYYKDPRLIQALSESVFNMVNGGSLGVKLRNEINVTEETYVRVAELKTAALFRAASTVGAICAGSEQSSINLMSRFGTTLGVAFQIKDDLLGLIGKEEETGKPVNSDLKNREKTLIAIHALNNAKGNDAEILRRFYGKDNSDGISPIEVKEVFERVGAINHAIDRSWSLVNEAKSMIAEIPDSQSKTLLFHICDFAVTRTK